MFHVSLLKQNTTRKGRVSKKVLELDANSKNNEEYKVEVIWNNIIYANKLELGYLLGLYYLVM